jgi:hypothetical protein
MKMKKPETRTENIRRAYIAPSIESFGIEAEVGILAASIVISGGTFGTKDYSVENMDGGIFSPAPPSYAPTKALSSTLKGVSCTLSNHDEGLFD